MTAVSVKGEGQGNPLLTLALLGDRDGRNRKLASAAVVLGMGARTARRWWVKANEDLAFSVSVPDDDEVYAPLHQWIVEQLPPDRRRSILVRSSRVKGQFEPVSVSSDDKPESPALQLYLRSDRAQTLVLDGHRLKVQLERSEAMGGDAERRWKFKPDEIVITARTEAGRDAVIGLIERLAETQRDQPQVRVYIAQRWGDWDRRPELVGRSLESVVLKAGQKESLVDDLRDFLSREADYLRLGIPWHRGILLSGPPGTGKTSLARALASHLRLDLYYIPLSAIPNDSTLVSLLGRITPRSMLLLEDIDIVHGARVRDDGEAGVTLSGLLNGLDGLLTPHGLVTCMTTNDESVIDPALTRPGRIDQRLDIGFLDRQQLGELIRVIVGEEVDLPTKLRRLSMSPAEVVEVCKRHLGSTEETILALKELVA